MSEEVFEMRVEAMRQELEDKMKAQLEDIIKTQVREAVGRDNTRNGTADRGSRSTLTSMKDNQPGKLRAQATKEEFGHWR